MKKIIFVVIVAVVFALGGCSKNELVGSYSANIHEDQFNLQIHDSSRFTLDYEFVVYTEEGEKTKGFNSSDGTYSKNGNFYTFELGGEGASFIMVKDGENLLYYENEHDLENFKEDGITYIRN